MDKKNRDGLMRLVELIQATSELEPQQVAALEKQIRKLLQAASTRNSRAVQKAVSEIARIFLRSAHQKSRRAKK